MSAKITANPLIKALSVLAILFALYIASGSFNDSDGEQATSKAQNANSGRGNYDTPNEDIAAVSGYVSNLEGTTERLEGSIDELRSSQVTKDDIKAMIKEAVSSLPQTDSIDLNAITDDVVQSVKDELNSGEVSASQVGDIDDALAFEEEFEINSFLESEVDSTDSKRVSGAGWVMPLGHQMEGEQGAGLFDNIRNPFEKGGDLAKALPSSKVVDDAVKEIKSIPYGTIPADSNIFDVVNLNSLYGRIPRKKSNYEPYEFSLVLSSDTLMANGFSFPQIDNAMMSGYAVGDRALSCVRGYVTSFTFIFSDGRIFQQMASSEKEPLAVIGDKWGNGCVKGEIIEDIDSYITAQAAIAGLSTYSDQVAKQQQSVYSVGNSTSLDLTGSSAKLAAGTVGTGALNQTAKILADRYESYHAGVYVPQGGSVTVKLKQNINIDYDPKGRKVNYGASENTAHAFSSFD
ncbi:hypothetical protein [Vibrio rotiferianus]|uniref:hypothetical protein n=1 Tax=Vibrio rotiferianus TaxID=190895 RepID=UPI0005EE895E|nr:hypothetical protein [Vibrio rotiferianus]